MFAHFVVVESRHSIDVHNDSGDILKLFRSLETLKANLIVVVRIMMNKVAKVVVLVPLQ
jgi:hypothetical protein